MFAPQEHKQASSPVEQEQVEQKQVTPTMEQFSAYEAMAGHFNERLFGGRLPPVLLNFSRRGRRNRRFFAPNRWQTGGATTHEVSLNPQLMAERSAVEIAATLVHAF